ncbi:hypothetical protein ACHAPM_002331 [Fusarium culmorum]
MSQDTTTTPYFDQDLLDLWPLYPPQLCPIPQWLDTGYLYPNILSWPYGSPLQNWLPPCPFGIGFNKSGSAFAPIQPYVLQPAIGLASLTPFGAPPGASAFYSTTYFNDPTLLDTYLPSLDTNMSCIDAAAIQQSCDALSSQSPEIPPGDEELDIQLACARSSSSVSSGLTTPTEQHSLPQHSQNLLPVSSNGAVPTTHHASVTDSVSKATTPDTLTPESFVTSIDPPAASVEKVDAINSLLAPTPTPEFNTKASQAERPAIKGFLHLIYEGTAKLAVPLAPSTSKPADENSPTDQSLDETPSSSHEDETSVTWRMSSSPEPSAGDAKVCVLDAKSKSGDLFRQRSHISGKKRKRPSEDDENSFQLAPNSSKKRTRVRTLLQRPLGQNELRLQAKAICFSDENGQSVKSERTLSKWAPRTWAPAIETDTITEIEFIVNSGNHRNLTFYKDLDLEPEQLCWVSEDIDGNYMIYLSEREIMELVKSPKEDFCKEFMFHVK